MPAAPPGGQGAAVPALQALFIWYLAGFAWQYLSKIGSLGTVGMHREWNEARQIYVRTPGTTPC